MGDGRDAGVRTEEHEGWGGGRNVNYLGGRGMDIKPEKYEGSSSDLIYTKELESYPRKRTARLPP